MWAKLIKFFLDYWPYLLAVGIAVGLIFAYLAWMSSHDAKIVSDTTALRDAACTQKNAKDKAAFDKALSDIKTKQKIIKNTAKPVSQRELINLLQAGEF